MHPPKATVVCIREHPYDYDVYVGRAGKGYDGTFGNPFRRVPGDPPGATIPEFRKYFIHRVTNDPEFRKKVLGLAGKRLGCFCATTHTWDGKKVVCHAQVIADWLNEGWA